MTDTTTKSKEILIPGEPIASGEPIGSKEQQEQQKENTALLIKYALHRNEPHPVDYSPVEYLSKLDSPDAHFKGPLTVDIQFGISISDSLPDEERINLINKIQTGKPNIGSLVQFYFEVANKILYYDESQIHSFTAKKFHTLSPRTIITVTYHAEKTRNNNGKKT